LIKLYQKIAFWDRRVRYFEIQTVKLLLLLWKLCSWLF